MAPKWGCSSRPYGKEGLKADFPRCDRVAPDGQYCPAQAEISGKRIILTSDRVAQPLCARYCWSNVAVPNLHNQENLPPISFRTTNTVSLGKTN
jgi:hypothetical protein